MSVAAKLLARMPGPNDIKRRSSAASVLGFAFVLLLCSESDSEVSERRRSCFSSLFR
jgi:hypothetical protein